MDVIIVALIGVAGTLGTAWYSRQNARDAERNKQIAQETNNVIEGAKIEFEALRAVADARLEEINRLNAEVDRLRRATK